jgi:hypothetical protein
MYKKSIKENSKYLIPFVEGIKYYGSDEIEHVIGTMMILNKNGDLLTCKHIANEFINNDRLREKYVKLIEELNNCKNSKERKKIEEKYNITNNSVVLSNINLPFKINGSVKIEIKMHKYLDLAVIRFNGVSFNTNVFPRFSKELPEQGQSVCKLGYAFPEYSFFEYSHEKENIIMKKEIVASFPLFPMDGIVTRHVIANNEVVMIETSTPGLKGQSGGPVFSPEGVVYGIQSMTKHLDLNFDVETTVKRGIEDKNVSFTPFINLGLAVTSEKIIKFLNENNIEHEEV